MSEIKNVLSTTQEISRERSSVEGKWHGIFSTTDINFDYSYFSKIKYIKDLKIVEFNLKVLPCRENLNKWGK